jgi:hypothetical protein
MNKEYWDQFPKKECSVCKKPYPEPTLMPFRKGSDEVICSGCALNYEHDKVDSFFKSLGKKK